MSSGFLFPGQGGQGLGMLKDVPKEYIEACQKITGILLEETPLCYEDTVFTQLALVVKAAFYTDELKKREIYPELVAGHSIGAFAAAYACGVLNLNEMLALVYHRASLMKKAYPSGFGMGVIVGLTRSEVEELVAKTFDEAHPVYVSNENCPMQQTISGSIQGMEHTLEAAKQYQAQTAKLLKVAVPSHCLLMEDTVEAFAPFVEHTQLAPPSCTYLKNTDGRATTDKEEIRQDLLNNIAHPVQWNKIMDVTKELGMKMAIELPPGKTLTNLYQAKFGEEIRLLNLEQHGMEDTVFLYEKWR
ncbi:acyl transferase [Enterococcus sp. JM4C]|uniref:acyltransferase domain-containing protein n=1 Tax=Candidatus Enterococcus huntleyi TaxID=1857217 RepID=UPI001379CDD2|nr:acyltransferase domain-containing protein [Enterococcus sp. JM4C]KAF1297816.1 acyl transferase [Enterococcus sp. JM4C]